jgi:hypothetical protein
MIIVFHIDPRDRFDDIPVLFMGAMGKIKPEYVNAFLRQGK